KHGFCRSTENLGHILVLVGDSRRGVHHEKHQMGLFHGDLHLFFYFFLENIFGFGYKSARIDKVKSFPVPIRHAVLAISGHPTKVIYNCFTLFEQAIKQGGFPYIRSPDNSYRKTGHRPKWIKILGKVNGFPVSLLRSSRERSAQIIPEPIEKKPLCFLVFWYLSPVCRS